MCIRKIIIEGNEEKLEKVLELWLYTITKVMIDSRITKLEGIE